MAGSAPPLVSIGLPVFNGERYLARAVESLLAQTESRLELLISDNGSQDATQSIGQAFQSRDSRVIYVRHATNKGAYFNWNFVARQCTGRYFKWASANDYCEPQFLAACIQELDKDPTLSLCYPRTMIVGADDRDLTHYDGDFELLDLLPSVRFARLCRELALNNAQCGVIRNSMLSRTRYDRAYPGGDLVLMAELALLGKFRLVPEALLHRRLSNDASTRSLSVSETQAFFNPANSRLPDTRTWKLFLDYVRAVGCADIAIREKLRCLGFVARNAYWRWPILWRELRNCLRDA